MYYVDEKIVNLNRIFDQNSRKEYLRLDLNENPKGLPNEFIQKVLSEVDERLVSEYPETIEFTTVLANYLGCDIDNICLVNGSAEGIRYIIEAFTSPGGRITGVIPTYAMFEVYSKMYGRNFVPVAYTDELEMPVANIIEAMTSDTQLLILVNPNNPMGNTYTDKEFEMILEKAKKEQITVLVDEAYHYFYNKTFLKYALENEHIFITRTFSKLFSLAGARLGYVVGWKKGISIVQKLCTPHNVNAFAELFAQKIIEEEGLIDRLIADFNEGRSYLISRLESSGYSFKGESGNFLFIKPKMDADLIVKRMREEKKILIKSYNGVGKFGTCLRVSIGDKSVMEQFVEALLEIDR